MEVPGLGVGGGKLKASCLRGVMSDSVSSIRSERPSSQLSSSLGHRKGRSTVHAAPQPSVPLRHWAGRRLRPGEERTLELQVFEPLESPMDLYILMGLLQLHV